MPRHRSILLNPSEWKVMKIVWKLKACAACDVYKIAEIEYNWSPSTVKTILSRLTDKGYLSTTKIGNSYLYRPTRSAFQSLCHSVDALLENALEGTSGPLMAYLLKKSNLSEEDVDHLRSLLEEFKAKKDTDQ